MTFLRWLSQMRDLPWYILTRCAILACVMLRLSLIHILFQAAGYVVDVHRGKIAAERSFVTYALFVSFFPQLVSGPIHRARDLLPQFREEHPFDYDNLRVGLVRFLWGAFKKTVLADRLAVLVGAVFAAPGDYGALQLIGTAAAFSIQLYCDFSGYSDMAVGAARVMGFRLMENFRTPFFSRSIAEFWRRWHISLSSWFQMCIRDSSSTIITLVIFSTPFWRPREQTPMPMSTTKIMNTSISPGLESMPLNCSPTPAASRPTKSPLAILMQ